ncbi:MAG: M1 family metallopeptidase [Pyrinomonadaceae bacterium]|nr:M1 family metallopeptidase [Pyrinomonadaceae bacterium]
MMAAPDNSFNASRACVRLLVFIFLFLSLLLIPSSKSYASTSIDVLDYSLSLEPNLSGQTIAGEVRISFLSRVDNLSEITLDAQELQVEEVSENGTALKFEAKEGHLLIRLARAASPNVARSLQIRYSAKPTRGLKFFADHLYAAYNTPRWMPCNFEPGDRASLFLKLTLPENFKAVANGDFVEKKSLPGGRAQFVWRERASVPPYVYGFAAGLFQEVMREKNDVQLFFLARSLYTLTEVEKIFADTSDMLEFFEKRAGVEYPKKRYTQVLASGGVMQEMSAFTVLRENYGRDVLTEARENWLIAHEFAHQWWGIRVSCAGWSDFWLNEGFAEFMMSAYREHRFGQDEYDRDMEMARMSYAKIRAAGKDRPLAYRTPITESQAGGPIVYDKGALVVNLLRYELGEDAFWRGLRLYTTRNFDKSVVTGDLQKAMEEASGKALTRFFEQWIYTPGVPYLVARHRLEKGEVVVELEQQGSALWNIPLQIAVETSGGGRESRRVDLTERRLEVRFRLRGNLLSVRLDDGSHLPFRVKQEERPVSMLLYQLSHEPDTAGRAEALEQIQSLLAYTKEESTRAQLKAALEERAARDTTRLIRALAKRALEK